MDNLKIYLRPFLVLGLFLGLAISFRSFLMINIIEPIAVLLWAFWRIICSVNQNNYWIILIIFCLILVFRLVPDGNRNFSRSAYKYKYRAQSRVEHWQSLLTNAMMEKHGIESLRSNLKELLISMIDEEERSNPMSSEKAALLGQLPLPVSVQDLLFPPKRKHKIISGDFRFRPLFLTPKWFRGWARKFIQPDNTSIDEVLEWMESTMEINHDK